MLKMRLLVTQSGNPNPLIVLFPRDLATASGDSYLDLWTNETVSVGTGGDVAIRAEEGIALLWQSDCS
ncbi:hypothetical protein [Paenibacillus sp. Soil787]|uniref:hypothetical protein n=1 Tax=Paenibacillus sp. Soil787 TaxID=1736411 RepID=UPI0007038AAC|nr:hypothetical protein [Paenibacillus sp. Soil787]KRF09935.1 hypothetical protein ASG93_19090 [Paenibacillus sp. Soil787]